MNKARIYNRKSGAGFTLVELLVVIVFISVFILIILQAVNFSEKLKTINEEKTAALLYVQEGMEAARLIAWDNLQIGTWHLVEDTGHWILMPNEETIAGKYNRQINISSVNRQNQTNGQVYGPIVDIGGYLDNQSKKVTVAVNWTSKSGAQSETMEQYVYRWQASRWVQTDWQGGSGQEVWTVDDKFSNRTSGIDVSTAGIVTLKSGVIDWSNATTTDMFDTPGNFDNNDVDEQDNKAYLVTQNNASGPEFYVLNVADIHNISQLGTLNIGASVTSVVASGTYAYLSTGHDSRELEVINISNPNSPSLAAQYSLPSNTDAQDIAVNANEVYIIQGSTLYSFSIVDPLHPQLLDSVSVSDTAREIYVSGSYVYVATQATDKELQVVDITNPANLQVIGQYDLPGSLKGSDVAVIGNRVYIATENNGLSPELYILDISSPAVPIMLGSFEVGETVHSLAVAGPYVLLGTNFLNEELVVFDATYPATINQVSGFDLDGYILGMSANCSIIYAATSSNQGEFFVISTEVADCAYSDSGVLESSTFDTGSTETVYNWLSWDGHMPLQTTIRLQLATSDSVNGPWAYLGPDGTGSSYYTNAGNEFINYSAHQGKRYARYKLFLNSTADFQAPVLEELTISYSAN